MEFLIPAVIVAFLGSINPRSIKFTLIAGTIWTFLLSIAYYAALLELVGPLWGVGFSLFFVAFVNAIIEAVFIERVGIPAAIAALTLVVLFIIRMYASPMFRANEYYQLIGKVDTIEYSDHADKVDIKHIREVSREQAEKLGGRALGDADNAIGSRFRPGHYSIQRVAGELYWVAPLEYQGFSQWSSLPGTPGYVMVSAEDSSRHPELHLEKADGSPYVMKYVESGWFSENVRRHVYRHGYNNVKLREATLEIDENFNPWWVLSVLKPTIAWGGDEVLGVVLVNPETGKISYKKIGDIPEWVDRVYPEKTVEKRMTWWGHYAKGWLNHFWYEDEIIEPARYDYGLDVWLTWSGDNQPQWFSGMTSVKKTDQSMVGAMTVNSRTGQASYFKLGGVSEDGVVETVKSALGAEGSMWKAVQPILYNVYGEPTWIMPIISAENLFQQLAAVRISTSEVVRAKDKVDLIRQYRQLLSSNGENVPAAFSNMARADGTIVRISADVINGASVYFFTIDSVANKIFTGASSISPELPLTVVGDGVSVSYINTDGAVVQIESFDSKAIKLDESNVQKKFQEIRRNTKVRVQKDEAVHDLRKKIEAMSSEELEKLQQQIAK